MGWTTGVQFPAGAMTCFFFSISPRLALGVHPASHTMGTGGKVAWEWCWPLTSTYCQGQECVE